MGLILFRKVMVHTSLWLSFGAAGVALMTFVILQSPPIGVALLIPLLSTFFLYNLNKRTDVEEDRINSPERSEFIGRYGKVLFFMGVLSYIIALALSLQSSAVTLVVAVIPFGLVFFYSVLRLKKIFILKDLIVPTGWGMIPLLVLTFIVLEPRFAILPLFIFSRSIVITICYDIKDVTGDKATGIRTIPNVFGEKFTKRLLYTINIVFLAFFCPLSFLLSLQILALFTIVIFLYSIFYISLMDRINIRDLCEVLSAGEYIVIGLTALVFWALV